MGSFSEANISDLRISVTHPPFLTEAQMMGSEMSRPYNKNACCCSCDVIVKVLDIPAKILMIAQFM